MAWSAGGERVSFAFPGVVGPSAEMAEVLRLLELVAPTEATVLLLGETGTGKELAAQAIHRNSLRRDGPFVAVNCATLPETLLESELFGHERGAFSGAVARKEGRLALAHRGTLFLDEVAEFSPAIQAKILRVLQTREFEPLGGSRTVKVDVRLVAATNRDLEALVREGRFREDLFFRLNVFPVVLPPLKERLEDLPLLAGEFLKTYARKNHRRVAGLSPEVEQAFRHYPWPGNIRELENAIERGVIICLGEILSLQDLPPAIQRYALGLPEEEPELELAELERQLIRRTLDKVAG
jgi:two-component system response regulator HydG